MADETCSHIETITTVKHAKHRQCDECVKLGARWIHLRICQECGATRCCNDSPNRHATARAREQTSRDRIGGARGTLVVLLSGRGFCGILSWKAFENGDGEVPVGGSTERDSQYVQTR